ncbi:MAG TPA: isopentenyl phosphate kinase [Longilinea sp.]|nr:isopentenyl phosphate kinase [Longilinea sp.]
MLLFVKLGGSLITDKSRSHTFQKETMQRLAAEIQTARKQLPELRLVLGHGSGSFGHIPAAKYHTRDGVHTQQEWAGFLEVWREARSLNDLVMESLHAVNIPAIPFSPVASVISVNHQIQKWDIDPIQQALQNGLVPVVYGDVIFDGSTGGTIFSTEELFEYLALSLKPSRILLAGIEKGIYKDFPDTSEIIPEIRVDQFEEFKKHLSGSVNTDVTGGMLEKAAKMLDLIKKISPLEVIIFSGAEPGILQQALLGANPGTRLLM